MVLLYTINTTAQVPPLLLLLQYHHQPPLPPPPLLPLPALLTHREGVCGLVAVEWKVPLLPFLVPHDERVMNKNLLRTAPQTEVLGERRKQALAVRVAPTHPSIHQNINQSVS